MENFINNYTIITSILIPAILSQEPSRVAGRIIRGILIRIRLIGGHSNKKIKKSTKIIKNLYSDPVLICARLVLDKPESYIKLPNHLAILPDKNARKDYFLSEKNNILEHTYKKLEKHTTIKENEPNECNAEQVIYHEIIDNIFVWLNNFITMEKNALICRDESDKEISYWIDLVLAPCHTDRIKNEYNRRFMLIPYLIKYYGATNLSNILLERIKRMNPEEKNAPLDHLIKNTTDSEILNRLEELKKQKPGIINSVINYISKYYNSNRFISRS
ncbi:MAG: hypothetical protein HQL99_12190 [Magnetococcales bacterium]|nr:hypothetical protein [Magnetococcales bacterium]